MRVEVVITRSPEETMALGERLARELSPGDCLALVGELGAGKTTLIKGLARGLGLPEAEAEVLSPSFILVREYRGGRLPLYHIDAYRISRAEELGEIGLEEYLWSEEGVAAVEWADRLRGRGLIPPGCITLKLEILSESERRITILRPAAGSP